MRTRQLDLLVSAQTTVLAARRVQAQRCKTTSALRFPLVGIGMLKNTCGKWHLSGGRRRLPLSSHLQPLFLSMPIPTSGTRERSLFGSAAPTRAAQPRELFEPKLGGPIAASALRLESFRRYRIANTNFASSRGNALKHHHNSPNTTRISS